MKCKSIIEIEKKLRKEKHEKKETFPLLSRTGVPGWETGTTGVSQLGQINVFVVVDVWSHVEEDKVYHKVIEEHFTLMEKLCLLLLLLLLFNSHVHNRWDFSFSLTASIGLATR